MVSFKSNALLIASLLVVYGCQSKPSSPATSVSAPLVLPMDVHKGPISLPSKEPALAPALGNADGHIKLVWLEQVSSTPKTHALMLSEFRDGVWGNTRKLYESPSIFANWADTPTVTTNPRGDTVVHWAEKSGKGTYAYDVRIGIIRDESFYDLGVVHRDKTETEHGFVSVVPQPDHFEIFWLDGRNTSAASGHHTGDATNAGAMTLRTAQLKGLKVSQSYEIDSKVCDCCNTSATSTPSGSIIAYRDRAQDEVRDISIARHNGTLWTKPERVSHDNWKINGCPVNGPRVKSSTAAVALAWYTKPKDIGSVKMRFSTDNGQSWGSEYLIDGNDPLGRVDLVALPNGHFVLSWMARHPDGASIMLQRIAADGTMSPASQIRVVPPGRRTGVPRMAITGDDLVIVWTEPTEAGTQLEAARITWQTIGTPLLNKTETDLASRPPKKTPSLDTLTLQDASGRSLTPKFDNQQPLITALWAPWCGPCREELSYLDDISKRFNVNIAVLTPSTPSLIDTQSQIRTLGYQGPVWFFREPEFPADLHIDELPQSWVFNADGSFRSTVAGKLEPDAKTLQEVLR